MQKTIKRSLTGVAIATLLAGSPVAAEVAFPALPPAALAARPVSVLPADPGRDFVFSDAINSKEAPGSFTARKEPGGQLILSADNPKGSSNYNGINARWKSAAPVRKGDVMFARFAARALKARQESGEAEAMFYYEKPGADGRIAQAISVGPDWTIINVPFTAAEDAAPGEASIMISYGNLEQTIEITGFEVLNFGAAISQAALPLTRFSYAGREPDAAWRRAALERIERLRTAPLTIKVIDAKGRPVKGARVSATLAQPDFLWGSAVSSDLLVDNGADAERYRKEVIALFDTAVIENGFKWPRYVEALYRARAFESLDWLLARGKRVKGHNLVWPAWKFSPEEVIKDPLRGEKIRGLVEAHIRDITAATKGKLIGWDVVNEPIHETDYFKHMPQSEIAKWFKLAEQSDPKLELTINEYSMLNRSSSPLFIADFKQLADSLRKQGARIDVLGVQGHVGQTPRAPVGVLSDLDLLAEGGNKVQITEFDFNTRDEALQADYTRDFLIALYSHPAASGFIQWGFWEGAHWKPDAAMYRKDWSEKPSLAVWKDLVLGAWKTRIDQHTGADGAVAARGHHGRYTATASAKGKSGTREFDLSGEGATVTLKLK